MVEEYGLVSIAIVSLQMAIGLLYSMVRLCRRIKDAHGHLSISSEPVVISGKLKPSPTAHNVPAAAKRNSVYFGVI